MSEHERDLHDLESDAELAALIRGASAADLPEGASARIAHGAWAARATGAPVAPLRLTGRSRRIAFVAAAAAGLFAAVLTLDGTERAMAVEGDPVQVWRDGQWKTGERVPFDRPVFAPAGERRFTLPDGSTVSPIAGTLFRVFVSGKMQESYSVRVLSGSVDVDGRSVSVEGGGLRTRRDPGSSGATFRVTMNGQDIHLSTAPDNPGRWAGTVSLEPRVHVLQGSALLELDESTDEMVLGAAQSATVMRLKDARAQIALLREFTDDLFGDVLLDASVLGARPSGPGGMRIFLGCPSRSPEAVHVPADRVTTALRGFNTLTVYRALELSGPEQDSSVQVDLDLTYNRTIAATTVREVRHVRDGEVTAVTTDGKTARLEQGGKVSLYPSLGALLKNHPDVKVLFGDRLGE